MPSIQSSGYPLVFKVAEAAATAGAPVDRDRPWLRTAVRSLEGMQKEALVTLADSGACWRMVSDEGPYLSGTDLAPYPLAFFMAGLQFSLMSSIVRSARERGVRLESLELVQDNYYSMEGSFLRGDAQGGAMPAEVLLAIESPAEPAELRRLIGATVEAHPGHAVMRDALENTFALTLNGLPVSLPGLRGSPRPRAEDPGTGFDAVRPAPAGTFLSDIIRRDEAAPTMAGVEGGAGSSLRAEQKRTLHVQGKARLVDGLLMETRVRLFKPLGSTFSFLGDETASLGGHDSAPPPLAYLSAGVGFCYMTQLGRYAHILKQPLGSYAILQEHGFHLAGEGRPRSVAGPLDTQVFLQGELGEAEAERLVAGGERTCFLHAAMRGAFPSVVRVELNGRALDC